MSKLHYKNSSLPIEERVISLMSQMTLEEKLAQLTGVWDTAKLFLDDEKNILPDKATELFPYGIGQVARVFEGLTAEQMAVQSNKLQKHFIENTRLGIPVLFHQECLHGVMEVDAISFPHPIALAASFNTDLVEKMYEYAAKDARARGARLAFTPVLDVARDPRWGRVEETFGEDPYLVAQMGTAAVKGFQGDISESLQDNRVMATLKHFAAHGQPENGTNCAPANFSERVLRETFLYPFKYAIEHARPLSIMASYNEIDGVPSHANKWLLKNVLRGEYGFEGIIVSDYYAIEQLVDRHQVAANPKQAAKLALEAGVNIELPEPNIFKSIPELLENNEIEMDVIHAACERLLYYKFFAGLFDNPYVNEGEAQAISEDKDAVELSYTLATESITLLQNNNQALPLQLSKNQKIAVVGPNAKYHAIGGYSCPNKNFTTIFDGLVSRIGNKAEVLYAKGCGITTDDGSWFIDEVVATNPEDDKKLIQEAVEVAKQADTIVLCIGGNEQTSREAWKEQHLGDRPTLELVGLQNDLVNALAELGKPIIVVLTHGRPLAIQNVLDKSEAVLDCWYLGQETGNAVADILLGTVNPSAKLPISYPRSAGHLPVFYNYKPTARRGYLFDDISPLFPFGFGLSYTKFSLQNIELEQAIITKNDVCRLSVNIENIGSCKGAEVVQVYVRDVVSSVTRPVKELKAFMKVELDSGEKQTLSFELSQEDFAFYNLNMEFEVESGEFEIMVGTSSQNEDLETVVLTIE